MTKRLPATELPDGDERLNNQEIQNALAFKREMESRGTAIILTQVPYVKSCDRKMRELAQLLAAPIVRPHLENLTTFDGSHLSPESAARFSTAFFADFFSNPEVVAALADKSNTRTAAKQREMIRIINQTESGSRR